MKPTEIKKSILSLNKKAIANLSEREMLQINGGLAATPPSDTVTDGFPITLACSNTIILTANTLPITS